MSSPARPATFVTQIVCPACDREGYATWVKNSAAERSGISLTASSPVSASDGFYLRVARLLSANPQIVCGRCGAVHHDTAA